MSTAIAIMGNSGSGKTTSLRNLDPATTFIIDADGKGLSWQGWKRQYIEGKNYLREKDPERVAAAINQIATRKTHVKTLVIDTANAIMIGDEMKRIREKGYDKWADLAQSVYHLVTDSLGYRDDLYVIWMFFSETVEDELSGERFVRFQTSGRKLQKITLEAFFPIVLHALPLDDRFVFETRARQSVSKTPMGMFDSVEIPNDIAAVLKRVAEYESGDVLQRDDASMSAMASAATPTEAMSEDSLKEKLFELQQRRNISNAEVCKYIGEEKISDLSVAQLAHIVKEWDSIERQILDNQTPAKGQPAAAPPAQAEPPQPAQEPAKPPVENGDLSKAVRTIENGLKAHGISDFLLNQYLTEKKGYLQPGQEWRNAPTQLIVAIAGNWPKIAEDVAEDVPPF